MAVEGFTPGGWRDRMVAKLPTKGTLLVATDLQGNWGDYCTLKDIYAREKAQGNDPVLLFCGDMVHGPGEALADPSRWPEFLGSYYEDNSAELILDFMRFSEHEHTMCLMGNHEHAHVGGPVVSKFHPDEAAVLNARLGSERERVRAFMASFPLIAVSQCGAAFTHGAPRRTEPDLEAFEALSFGGYDEMSVMNIHETSTVGALLWSRHAEPERARAFLAATTLTDRPGGFVVYGHDVVRDGYEKIGDEQLCLSTSFGCDDSNKHYLRLDLSTRYNSVHDLRLGRELLPLYPSP